jgi:hypothetical protein
MLFKDIFAKICLIAVISLLAANSACGQKLVDITDKKDVQIDIQFVGKPGKVKKYLIENGGKPIEPAIPDTYQVFEKKYYKVETDAISYGDVNFTFKAPAKEEDFTKVRILHLVSNELNPNGFEWQDCTITSESLGNPSDENYSESYNERLKKFLPDFSRQTVSCELRETMKQEEFFVVTLQTQASPKEPFTRIVWNLETKEVSADGRTSYKLMLTNAGTKDIAEFNFRSVFDLDTKLNSFKPSQGTCRVSTYSSSYGSTVCHFGKMPAGASATLELEGESSGMNNYRVAAGEKNRNWSIFGIFKESPNAPLWGANTVWFKPILNKDLLKK